jgi:hypothetical protein
MKYGNLNFLEPSGPLQACNGTALPKSFVEILTSKAQLHFTAPLYVIRPHLEGVQGKHSCEDIHATESDVTVIFND